jgi:Fe-S cluster biogenesis protein NfuA
MPFRRRIGTLVFALAVAFGAVASAGADPSGGANHVVIVQNDTDGATLARASTQVVPVASDTVTSANIAAAINAGCTGCHSTAVAVQILIVTGNPSFFAPGNVAAASNGGCQSCGAYAYARQHWIQTSGPAHLDGATYLRIAQLRQQISEAASSILPSDLTTDPCVTLGCTTRDEQLDEKLDALSAELIQVVTDGITESGASSSVVLDRIDTTPGS